MVILRANELGAYCVRVPSRLLSIAFHKFSKFCKHKPQQFNTLHIPYAHIIPGRVVIGCNNSFVSFSPSRSYCLPFGFSFSIQCCSKIQCYRPDTKPNKIQRGGQHVYVRIKMWPWKPVISLFAAKVMIFFHQYSDGSKPILFSMPPLSRLDFERVWTCSHSRECFCKYRG